MMFISPACDAKQEPYLATVDELSRNDRLELEAHAARCVHCAEELRDAVAIDLALRRAFAPLRRRHTSLAPGRARMAAASANAVPKLWQRAPGVFARVAEVSVALGVTLFALTGAVETPAPQTAQPRSIIREYFRAQPPSDEIQYFRWLRLAMRPSAPDSAQDAVRLPAGGVFDVEAAEIVPVRAAMPR